MMKRVGLALVCAASLVCSLALLVGCSSSEEVSGRELTLYLNNYNGTEDAYQGTYTGTLVNGVPHGEGTFETTSKDDVFWSYEGKWASGHMEGEGVSIWGSEEGYSEVGTYKADLFISGTISFSDFTYEGSLDENGYYTGIGTLTFRSAENEGDSYEGSFANGYYNGQGTYHYADGRRYEGAFVDDAFCGQGTFYNADGSYYRGTWADDALNGTGGYYDKTGKLIESGTYVKGVLQKNAS